MFTNMIENNNTCPYPIVYSSIIKVCQCGTVSTVISILAFLSNSLTIVILCRVRNRSSTENLLLAITTTDFLLPLIHLARCAVTYFRHTTQEMLIFISWHFFPWQYFYLTSILFTLMLAVRRYIAIEHAHQYQTWCSRKNTNRVIIATCIFSGILILPHVYHVPNYKYLTEESLQICKDKMPEEVIYYSIVMATVYMHGDYRTRITYWSYIFVFQVLFPFILAILSFKFVRALSIIMTSPNGFDSKTAKQRNQKTKLILIVSLLVLARDLPLGLLATLYVFISPSPEYLATVRLLTKELTIIMSTMNFIVLYCTNQRFKEAVPCFRTIFCLDTRASKNNSFVDRPKE